MFRLIGINPHNVALGN